jgi:site-specific recombinase XerD
MSKAMEIWDSELSNLADGTVYNYRRNLRDFCERWSLTPDELYELRLSDLESADRRDARNIERKLKIQMTEMRERGLAAGTCRNFTKGIAHFFESQDLELKLKPRDKPKGQTNGQRLVLADQLKEMYDNIPWTFKTRNQAILLFLKDSGLRVSDIARLNYGHYNEAQIYDIKGESFMVFKPFETKKTKSLAYIHIGPESTNSLMSYLWEREKEHKEKPKNDSPLFLMKGDKRFTRTAIGTMVKRLAHKLVSSDKLSAHSLRKFHTTMLESSMPKAWIAKLQGKIVNDSMGRYSQPEHIPEELFRSYANAYNKLRIFTEIPRIEIDELKKQTDAQQILMTNQQELIADQQKQLQELRQLFDQVATDWLPAKSKMREDWLKRMTVEQLPDFLKWSDEKE